MKMLEKSPPTKTANPEQDISQVLSYLGYIQQQMNFILRNLDKQNGNTGSEIQTLQNQISSLDSRVTALENQSTT